MGRARGLRHGNGLQTLVVLADAPRVRPGDRRAAKIDISKAPIAAQQQLQLIGVSGGDLVFSTEGLANMRSFIVRYDRPPTAEQEGRLLRFPSGRAYTQTAWLGDRYAAADGSSGLQIYSLDSDTWETITPDLAAQLSGGQRDRVDGSRPHRVEWHRVRALQPHPGGRHLTRIARLTAAPSLQDPRYRREPLNSSWRCTILRAAVLWPDR